MRISVIFLCCIHLFSAAKKKPKWLTETVVTDDYYTGIATVSKKRYPDTYRQKALSIALSFLSSEIKIQIKSQVRHTSKEHGGEVDLKFQSDTQTNTDEEVKGYEIVDKWENRREYALYCRLSKQKYLESKRELFSKDFKMIYSLKGDYENAVENRDLSKAVRTSIRLSSDSKRLLSNGSWHSYMTDMELSDLLGYQNILPDLLGNIKCDVEGERVTPFTWFNGDSIKIVIEDKNGIPWNHWEGILCKGTRELYRFGEGSEGYISFYSPIFISYQHDINFTLRVQLKVKKQLYKDIKVIDLDIPVGGYATLGKLSGKNISRSLKKEFKTIISEFITGYGNSGEKDRTSNRVDVFIDFDKIYHSSGWVSGILKFHFKNSSFGEGCLEFPCGGETPYNAVKNGLYDFRRSFLDDVLVWK